jgi:hypothetical protein
MLCLWPEVLARRGKAMTTRLKADAAGAVTAGPFAVRDRVTGEPLCHGARQTRGSLNMARRRLVIAAWEEALTVAGLMTGDVVVCTDMVERSRGRGMDARDGFADLGHIIADALDGAFCGCNAVPVEGRTNREDGDARPAIHWTDDMLARYADAWREVALRTMTGTKRARA